MQWVLPSHFLQPFNLLQRNSRGDVLQTPSYNHVFEKSYIIDLQTSFTLGVRRLSTKYGC